MKRRSFLRGASVAALGAAGGHAMPAAAQNTRTLDASARTALANLLARTSNAKVVSERATAVLVFPRITKVGLIFGGQYGEGVLFRDGKATAYYSTLGGSWGLQAGAQQYGYAMFFMNEQALAALNSSNGFEIGVGPTVVFVDQGMANLLTTMNLQSDIYAFVFSQRGLMAGLGLRGNRIARLSTQPVAAPAKPS